MGQDFDAHDSAGRLTVTLEDGLLDLPLPSLPGEHQHDNAALAAVALLKLSDPTHRRRRDRKGYRVGQMARPLPTPDRRPPRRDRPRR